MDIQYYNGTIVNNKMFLMSDREVCSNYSLVAEGIMWDYWKQKTGLTSPSSDNNSGRIMKDRNGTAQYVWLRSRYTTKTACYVSVYGGILDLGSQNSIGVLPACFISKDN